MELRTDLPVAEFLERHFGDQQYSALRREIRRMVEGYDAADASKASTFALRDEWTGRGPAATAGLPGDMARSSAFSCQSAAGRASRSVSARR